MKMAEDSIVFSADAMNNKDQLRWGVKKLCGIWHSSSGREVHSTAADWDALYVANKSEVI